MFIQPINFWMDHHLFNLTVVIYYQNRFIGGVKYLQLIQESSFWTFE